MNPSRIRSVLAVGAALAIALLPLGSGPTAQGKGTIKIATQSPLSGGQAALGEGIKLGTQLAIEKFKDNLEKAAIKVVIGHLNSGVAIPSSEVYKEDSLAMISPANTNEKVTDRGYPNVNRVCGRDDVQGPVGAEFAAASLKIKTAYVLHDKTTYGQGVAEAFKKDLEKKGVKIIGFEGTEEKSNFDPIITPIKAKNPDLVYFGGIYDQGAPFFKQAREKGVKAKFLGPDGMDSSDFVKIGGKVVVGTYYTTAAAPASSPQAKQFGEEFKKKYGKNPEPYAAESYVATAIAIKALEDVTKGGKAPTRAAVGAAIRKVKYNGMTGTIEFDDKGDPKKASYYFLQVSRDTPEKWSENKEAKRLAIAAPAMKK